MAALRLAAAGHAPAWDVAADVAAAAEAAEMTGADVSGGAKVGPGG
jgi:hypothetical protein